MLDKRDRCEPVLDNRDREVSLCSATFYLIDAYCMCMYCACTKCSTITRCNRCVYSRHASAPTAAAAASTQSVRQAVRPQQRPHDAPAPTTAATPIAVTARQQAPPTQRRRQSLPATAASPRTAPIGCLRSAATYQHAAWRPLLAVYSRCVRLVITSRCMWISVNIN